MLSYYVQQQLRRRRRNRRQNNLDTENRGILDLTSLGISGPEPQKRKMVPPGISNRHNFSYEDQIDNATADVQLLGDSAEWDAANTTNIFNAQRDLPADPESRDDLSAERLIAHGLDVKDGGQGIQPGAVEQTWYPQSGLRVTKRLI